MTTPIRRLSLLATAITTAAWLVAGAQVATAADPGDSAKGTINPDLRAHHRRCPARRPVCLGHGHRQGRQHHRRGLLELPRLRYSPAGASLGVLINNSGNGAN